MTIKEDTNLKNMKVMRIPCELIDGAMEDPERLKQLGFDKDFEDKIEVVVIREIGETEKAGIKNLIDGLIPDEHRDRVVVIEFNMED